MNYYTLKTFFAIASLYALTCLPTAAQNIAEFEGPVVIKKSGLAGGSGDVGLSIYRNGTRYITLMDQYGNISLTAPNVLETIGGDITLGQSGQGGYHRYASFNNDPGLGTHISPIGNCPESTVLLGLTLLREDLPQGPLRRSANCDAGGHRLSVFPEERSSGTPYFESFLGLPTKRWTTVYSKQIQNDGGIFTSSINSNYLYVTNQIYAYNLPYGDHANLQYQSSTGRFFYDNSSRRYKENITPLKDNFQKILRAQPVTYTRPDAPDHWEVGYVAEEMEELGLQKLLSYDEEGLVNNFNYEKMILYVVEVLKDHENKIDQQAKLIEMLTRQKAVLTEAAINPVREK